MRINFNSYCLSIGGGNRTILELADGLVDHGHEVTITHMGHPSYYSWYGKPKAKISSLSLDIPSRFFQKYWLKKKGITYELDQKMSEMIPECDINVATACETVYPTLFSGKGKLYHLVQHDETIFYSDTYQKNLVNFSYDFKIKKLCVSQWLTDKYVVLTLATESISISSPISV